MKKLNKVASLFATAALAASASTAFAQSGADQWKDANGNVWKNGTNELCWRDAFWTPATAAAGSDQTRRPSRAMAASGIRRPSVVTVIINSPS